MLVPYLFPPGDHVISHQSASVPILPLIKVMPGMFNKATVFCILAFKIVC